MAQEQFDDIDHLIYLIAGSTVIQTKKLAAFEKLYLLFWRPLKSFALKNNAGAMEAEDIVQELFADLWQCRDELFPVEIQNREQLVKWLLSKLRGRVSNFKKRKSRTVDFEDKNYSGEIQLNAVDDDGPQEELERKEFDEKMEEVINGLPREMRIVYNHKVKKGYNLQQIASEMGVTITQVREYFDKAKTVIEEKMMLTYLVRRFISDSLPKPDENEEWDPLSRK